MPYTAAVYRVMIATPSDVQAERAIIREIVNEWNIVHSDSRNMVLMPVGWETHSHPAIGDRPQSIINSQILDSCDLLVGVFWTRIGTSTGDYVSGTVEEIERHTKNGKPAMIYFSDAPVHLKSVDESQYSALIEFKKICQSKGLFEEYSDLNDFRTKFYRQLQLKINHDASFRAFQIDDGLSDSLRPIPQLSREAQILLKEAAQDSHGSILYLDYFGGTDIQTNGKQMFTGNNPKNLAIWFDAIKQLEVENLITDKSGKGEVYGVTREGYELSEILNP